MAWLLELHGGDDPLCYLFPHITLAQCNHNQSLFCQTVWKPEWGRQLLKAHVSEQVEVHYPTLALSFVWGKPVQGNSFVNVKSFQDEVPQ